MSTTSKLLTYAYDSANEEWQCEEVTNITIFVNHLDNSIQTDTCGATISRGGINMPSTQKICTMAV